MGLLDFLSAGTGGGGLLDFLRNNAMNQQFTGGLPSDQAQYGASPQPMQNLGALRPPLQASAQATPPLPPPVVPAQAPAPESGGFGVTDRLGAGFRGMAANMGSGPIGALMGGIAGLAGMGQGSVANQTAKALLAKGVDPTTVQAAIANPELMKTIIAQTYGPHNIQSIGEGYVYDPKTNQVVRAYTPEKSPISLGNGYIYNPQSKKVEQAYEPEDKIPQGFAKDKSGNLHFIPGGPADPAYKKQLAIEGTDPSAPKVLGRGGEIYHIGPDGKVVIDHKNEQEADATLDDPTTKAMAAQYLAGDRTVMQNLGRGAQGAANIVKLRTEIYKQASAQGLDGKGIVDNFNEQAGALAGQRTVGTRAANISLAANEANNMIPIAVEASKAVPRTQYVPLNKAIQMVQTGSSSPELARFVAATNSLVNAYVRAVSPSGVPTDSMREHAYHMLNSAQSHEAYVAVTKIMQDEMKAALTAPGQVQKELRRGGDKSEESSKVKVIDGYKIMEH